MRTFWRLLGFLRPYRRGVTVSFLLAAFAMGTGVLIPYLVGRTVNEIEQGGVDLWPLALAVAGAGLFRLAFSVSRRLVAGRVSLGVEYDLRNRMYEHLHSLELAFFDRQQTGQLMSRSTVDLQSVRFFLGYGLIFIVQSALTILIAAGVMLAVDPVLAAVALAPMPFVIWVSFRYGRRNRPASQEVQQRIAELTAEAEENISGVRVVKAFAQEERQLRRFSRAVARVFDQSMVSTRLRAFYAPFIGFLPQLGLAGVLFVGGRQAINGSLAVGDFVAFYGYVLLLTSPMRMLGFALGMAQRAVASGARVFELLDRAPELTAPEGAPPLPAGDGRVELRGVTFGYDGEPVLRDIDLTVEPGRTVALVGPTGSGKTTLVMLIPRLYDTDEGSVLVDGVDVRSVDPTSLRREVAVVSDDAFLFSATLGDNIAYARPDASDEEVLAAARRAGPQRARRRAARRPRHAGRRARAHALGRAAPARGDRPGTARRAAHPHPRRRHLERRRDHREPHQGGTARGHGGPHHVRDRAPALHDRARRRGGRARERPSRGARQPRPAGRRLAALPRDRGEGTAGSGLPHPRRSRARGGGPVSARQIFRAVRGEPRRLGKLRHLLTLLRPYRGRVIVMLLALLVATAAALVPPYLAGLAIDAGIDEGDLNALTLILIAFVAAALINWGATYVQTYLINWVGQRALQDLRIQLFEHLQRLSIGFYSRNKAGVLISRLTNDVQALDQLVTEGIQTLFSSTLTLIGTAVILLVLDPSLALVTFLTFPVLLVGSVIFRIASTGAYRLTREKIAQVTAYLQETLSGVRVVRAFGQEPRHRRRFAELNDEHRDANMRTVHLNAAYFPSVELLSAVATAAILLYGGNQVLDEEVTIGVLASFVFYLQTFFDPIQSLSQLYTTYQAGMAALDKIFELLDEEPDLGDRPGARRAAARARGDRVRRRELLVRRGGRGARAR